MAYSYTTERNVLHRFIGASFNAASLKGVVGGMVTDTVEEGRIFNDGHQTVRARPIYLEDAEVKLGIQDPNGRADPSSAAAAIVLSFRDASQTGNTVTITMAKFVPRGFDMPLDYNERGAILTQSYKMLDTAFAWTVAA